MRHADDICDDPGMTIPERREKLHDWLEGYHRVAEGEPTDDPVFLALRDSQQRFDIPIELLDSWCTEPAWIWTSRSTGEAAGAGARTGGGYTKFRRSLYDYCYHVASVVGLVCIRIFGYRDPDAEPLAEHVGIAFQLTNILRDVKEDAQMGRIYLPQEDLERFGVTAGGAGQRSGAGAAASAAGNGSAAGARVSMRRPSSCCP